MRSSGQSSEEVMLKKGVASYLPARLALQEFERVVRAIFRDVLRSKTQEIVRALAIPLGEPEDLVEQSVGYVGLGVKCDSQCYLLEWDSDETVYVVAAIRFKRIAIAKLIQDKLTANGGNLVLNRSEIHLAQPLQADGFTKESVIRLVTEWCDIWEQLGGLNRYLPKEG